MDEYAEYSPKITVKYKDRLFEIRHFYDGFQAGEIKKEGKLRCFHSVGIRWNGPTKCFEDIGRALLQY